MTAHGLTHTHTHTKVKTVYLPVSLRLLGGYKYILNDDIAIVNPHEIAADLSRTE